MGFKSQAAAYSAAEKYKLTSTTANVLAVLAFHRNDKTGQCNPSNETICGKARISLRTMRRAIKTLRDLGLISTIRVHPGTGRGGSTSSYVLNMEETVRVSDQGANLAETGTDQSAILSDQSANLAKNLESTPLIKKEQERTGASGDLETVEKTFSEFWKIWPRKQGKQMALEAWTVAIADNEASVITAAARAYVDHPQTPTDIKFVKTPARWLREHCWEDVLAPTAQTSNWGDGNEWMGMDR